MSASSSDHAIWYYFPVLFTIKLAVPLLIATAAVLAWRPSVLRNSFMSPMAALRDTAGNVAEAIATPNNPSGSCMKRKA